VTTVRCPTPADTAALGARLASALRPGDVVVLAGPLGAGKTLFAGGIGAGLGVEEAITSPSFVLVREYDSGFLPLVHADVYRLKSINEFDDLDILNQAAEGVLVIEWGDAVEPALPDHLLVAFSIEGDGARVVTMTGFGERWANWESAP
jgi:tRNA threonylcarbamoyladenosine biosynthesis protein TsaE